MTPALIAGLAAVVVALGALGALVGTYKTAANWVTFADRIQPLSAYTP